MSLLPDWKWIVTKALSVWAFYAIILVSAAETVLAMGGESLNKSLPVGVYPLLTGIVALLGIYFRVVAQRKAQEVTGGDGEEP